MATYEKTARSPYHKYGKSPYRYSERYHAWRKAVLAHGALSEEALEADDAFRRAYGLRPRPALAAGIAAL